MRLCLGCWCTAVTNPRKLSLPLQSLHAPHYILWWSKRNPQIIKKTFLALKHAHLTLWAPREQNRQAKAPRSKYRTARAAGWAPRKVRGSFGAPGFMKPENLSYRAGLPSFPAPPMYPEVKPLQKFELRQPCGTSLPDLDLAQVGPFVREMLVAGFLGPSCAVLRVPCRAH